MKSYQRTKKRSGPVVNMIKDDNGKTVRGRREVAYCPLYINIPKKDVPVIMKILEDLMS